MPINIPTLIQIFGRVDRKNSHIDLPENQRKVHIGIYINVFSPEMSASTKQLSPEELYYAEKLYDYKTIQEIELEMNSAGIDAEINYDINFPNGKPQTDGLGNLYFENRPSPEYKIEDLRLTTYFAHDYSLEEIKNVIYIIKELFKIEPVWTYKQLLNGVRNPPFHMEFNTSIDIGG